MIQFKHISALETVGTTKSPLSLLVYIKNNTIIDKDYLEQTLKKYDVTALINLLSL